MFSVVLLGSCAKTTSPQTIFDSALVGHWEADASSNSSGTRIIIFHSDGTAHVNDGAVGYLRNVSTDGNILTLHRDNDATLGASLEYSISGSELTLTSIMGYRATQLNGTYNKQ